jgi:hypothetical protein
MTEQELRAMIRDAIARHLEPSGPQGTGPGVGAAPAGLERVYASHASFIRLPLARGGDGDGACLIEPTVRCNHCGYCQSYGH